MESIEHENFAPMFLICPSTGKRFSEPVRVANLPDICERSVVLQAIEGNKHLKIFTLVFRHDQNIHLQLLAYTSGDTQRRQGSSPS